MTVRRLDPETGDIVTQGSQFLTGREEIAQTIRTRLALYLGEYFRNTRDGTPWFEQILSKQVNRDTANAAIRNRIANTPGVVRLTAFSSDFNLSTRKLSITSSVLTEFGIVEIEFNG